MELKLMWVDGYMWVWTKIGYFGEVKSQWIAVQFGKKG